ncbi:MAG: hypothetical protein K6B72_01450 [Lachnospiraceae bacterium]|nr:hypothetical protein [Lachnospiraceae bacterium]
MITAHDLFGLNHYFYGEAFFGSYQGMRYRVAADPLKRMRPDKPVEEGVQILATVWPEPYSWASTADEEKSSESFPFSADGLEQAAAWLTERYEADRPRWLTAAEAPWTT